MEQKPHHLKHTRRRHTEQEWQDITAAWLAGASARALAEEFGLTPVTIYKRMSALGLGRRQTGDKPAPKAPILQRDYHPPEDWDAAIAEVLAGEFRYVVAARRGLNLATLNQKMWLKGVSRAKCAVAKPVDQHPGDEQENAAAIAAWRAEAHPAQLPPEGQWRTWLFQGGRGAGKTRAGAEWLAERAAASPNGVFALVGATMRDVREVMVDGVSGLGSLPHRARPRFEVGRQRVLFPSGAVAYAFSDQEPERLRGPQFEAAWADEVCAWKRPEYTLQMLRMGLRRGADPRLVVTTTPKPSRAFRALRAEPTCVLTQAGTATNAAHLSPAFLEDLLTLYGGTRLAAQELDGVLVEAADAALWTAAMLATVQGAKPPSFDDIVVGVDPPAGTGGSACGVIVAGRRDGKGYVLADMSIAGASPLGWAQRVATAARAFGASRIVAEANQGGDMVRTTLAAAGVPCAIMLVHATRNKRTRAEPVAALYERGRVFHCGAFVQLEEELMAMGDDAADLRLDRADALVWALTALLVDGGAGPRISLL